MRRHITNKTSLSAFCLGIAFVASSQTTLAADGTWDTSVSGAGSTLNWSDTANWVGGTVADGVDAVATFPFGSPASNTAGIVVDTNITIGSLVYSNNSSVSDFNLRGSVGNTLTFETTTGVPMIEVTAASNRLLSLGNGGTLFLAGTQGLTLRSSAGSALTGTGVDATSTLPGKAIRVQSIDVTALSGGITVDRGYVQLRANNQLGSGASTQGLTVGTADTVTFDRLAGVNFVADTQVTTLNGNSLGRIWSNGKTFTVGVNDATGGDFGGVFGVDFSGNVGTNNFIKVGSGTQTISGRINTNGLLNVTEGTLILSGTGNSVTELDGSANADPVFPTLEIASGADLTITGGGGNFLGALTGTGTLNIDNAGNSQRITYNANNTFNGSIVIKSGTLQLHNTGGQSVLGNNAVAIQLGEAGETDDATLQFSNRGSLGTGQIVTVVGGGTNTIVGNRNNTGQVTFTRGVVLSDADVNIEHTGRSGYRIEGGITGTGNVVFLGNTADTRASNDIAIRSQINNVGTITNSGTGNNSLSINGSNNGSIGANVTGIIQNSVSANPGVLVSDFKINADNSDFMGTADVISGRMTLLSTNALSANNVVSVDTNGILDVQNNVTIAGLNNGAGGAGTVTNESATDRTLTLAGGGSYVFNGAIVDGATNKLSVATSGSGTHELGGNNTYTGLTTINNGTTLKLGSATALGSSGIGGDETDLNSGGILDLNGQTTAETLIDIAGTIINSNTSTAAAITTEIVDVGNMQIGGAGDITLDNIRRTNGVVRRITKNGAGTLTLSGDLSNNRYGLTVNEGNVLLDKPDGVDAVSRFALIINNVSSTVTLLGNNQIHNNVDVNGTHQINAGTLDLNGFDEGIGRIDTAATDGVVTNSNVGTTSTLTLLGGDIDASYAGAVTGNLNLVKQGTNTQTLIGASTYTGSTTVSGGLLQVQGGLASDNLSIASGATLEIDTTTGDQQFNGGTISGDGTFIKSGTGNLLLGANGSVQNVSMSGGLIDVQEGTLRNEYGNGDWSANQASLNVASGAIVDTWDSAGGIRVDALTGEGTVTHTSYGSANNLTVGVNGGGGTFSGLITDDGDKVLGLVKEGAGTQVLTGNNNYQGTTTINGGTLQIGDGGTTGSLGAGDVTNDGVLVVDRSNTYALGNNISGTGSLELSAQAAADSNLSGTNSYTGGTTIHAGRFRLASDSALGDTSSTLTLNGGGIKNDNGALTLDAARNVVIDDTNGGRMQAGWNADLTVAGVVSGAGLLTIEGDSGRVVLSNTGNSFTGDIVLQDSNSTLVANSLGAGAYAGVISGDGTFTWAGEGAFTGTNTVTGATVVQSGGSIGGSGSFDGDLTLEAGSKFIFSETDTLTIAGAVNLFAGFGVDDIDGLGSGTAVGTYTLIDGTTTVFSEANIDNFGLANAFNLGGGLIAYFENGSLDLVVAVPEPSTFALLAGLLAIGSVLSRRRRG